MTDEEAERALALARQADEGSARARESLDRAINQALFKRGETREAE
jgi:hypothetical protein